MFLVLGNWAMMIVRTDMIGTDNNIPTTPQMELQIVSDNTTTNGLRLSDLPMIRGSRKFPLKIWTASTAIKTYRKYHPLSN